MTLHILPGACELHMSCRLPTLICRSAWPLACAGCMHIDGHQDRCLWRVLPFLLVMAEASILRRQSPGIQDRRGDPGH